MTHPQIHDTMEVKLAYAAVTRFKCLHWLQLAIPASGNTSLHKTGGVFWWAEQQNSASETEKGRKKAETEQKAD